MQKKNKGALNLAGLVLFLLALPFFFGMGGGAFAMAEVLPGQAAASFLPYTEKTESLSAKVFGTKDVEFSQTCRHQGRTHAFCFRRGDGKAQGFFLPQKQLLHH